MSKWGDSVAAASEFLVKAACEERDKALTEIKRLHRVIAKELTENDELGCEYTYVNILREENRCLREALEWYANGVYPGDESDVNGTLRAGKRARQAISQTDAVKEEKYEIVSGLAKMQMNELLYGDFDKEDCPICHDRDPDCPYDPLEVEGEK